MKKILFSLLAVALVIGAAIAQDSAKSVTKQNYEYGMIKWDGPDKIQIITPETNEFVRVFRTGVQLPEHIHDEEFCDVWAMNRVAKDGWEPVNLHSTRIMIRRQLDQ